MRLIFLHTFIVYSLSFIAVSSFAGDLSGSLVHEGLQRTYIVHVPTSLQKGVPLVVALHGGYGNGQNMADYTKLSSVSEEAGFLVVYPNAFADPDNQKNMHWNDGRGVQAFYSHRNNIDDVGFISDLIDKLVGQFDLDSQRVYVTGISNGAIMTERLGCELSNKIAAIAPVAGDIPLKIFPACHPSRSLPIAIFNGTKDPIVPWDGGYVYPQSGIVVSVMDTIQFWVENNLCVANPAVVWLPHVNPEDPTRIRLSSRVCANQSEVLLFSVVGGGHTWPGAAQYAPVNSVGYTNQDINASRVIWNFFKRHSAFSRNHP